MAATPTARPHAKGSEQIEAEAAAIERPERKQNPARSLNKDQLYDYIMGITNGWKGETYFYKSERQKQALFRDVTGTKSDVFLQQLKTLTKPLDTKSSYLNFQLPIRFTINP